MGGGPPLSDEQRISWIRLLRSDNIGPITFRNFVNRFGSAQAALDNLPDIFAKSKAKRPPRICSHDIAAKELEVSRKSGIRHVAIGENGYPPLLRTIADPPPLLLIQGTAPSPEQLSISIVGSRNASIAGLKMAERLAADLSQSGSIIVSGLARGIDTAAHRASLNNGTIAVLAGGHHQLYPPENKDLARAIVEHGGAIVSEMHPGFEPRGRDFPRRNRIVSGMSLGVVVVEASRRSGSLISARLAAEQGRVVFAVPGSPLDPRADGTNGLIRQGATLVRSADDILEDLRPMHELGDGSISFDYIETSSERIETPDVADLHDDVVETVFAGLSFSPISPDDIVHQTGIPAGLVLSALCELVVVSRAEQLENNTYVLSKL